MRFSLKVAVKCLLTALSVFLLAFNVWVVTYRFKVGSQDSSLSIQESRLSKLFISGNESNGNKTLSRGDGEDFKLSNTESPLLVWPDKEFYDNDRILNQLQYKPPSINNRGIAPDTFPPKKILVYNGLEYWGISEGQQVFVNQHCLVSKCEVTAHASETETADAILFTNIVSKSCIPRPAHQIWILHMAEPPTVTPSFDEFAHSINWTATYRHDSDIVAPYGKLVPYDKNVLILQQDRNFASGKTKQVAWFVTNCGGARNGRIDYAKELANYIQVDIFGQCGDHKCPRRSPECFEMLKKDYKFYLAFENCNCRDYITEKFFVNSLQNDIIPVVMGAAPEDYKRVAPPHSYIHVDDFESPRELADYLIKLDRNDDLYNEYFGWKGAWHHMETSFWCRLCAMLYKPRSSHSYSDLERWWRGPGVCIGKEQWRNKPRISKFIADNYDISSCGSSFRATYLFFFTIQWTLVITTLFVTKDFAVKSNLLS